MLGLKKLDWLVIALALMGIGASFLLAPRHEKGRLLIIYSGENRSVRSLKDSEFYVDGPGGRVRVKVQDRRVRIVESHCADGWCLRMGPVEKPGESIVCLPSRVMLTISGAPGNDDKDEVDIITR